MENTNAMGENTESENTESQNMKKPLIRLLKASEIECRIATINEKGLSLLLYKDARVDQRILDETFTPFGWMRTHQCIDGNLYCTVSVYDKESGKWISKQDVGSASLAEKEKGLASDSFKRACFNWGIGRELYSAPFIWISAAKVQIQDRQGKYYCNERFHVHSIRYNEEREITELKIAGGNGRILYEYRAAPDNTATTENEADNQKKEKQKKSSRVNKSDWGQRDGNTYLSEWQLRSFENELQRTGVTMQQVEQRYHVGSPEEMSEETFEKVMSALSRTETSEAA